MTALPWVRTAQMALAAFLGVTSVAGAIGLLTGLNVPPIELLRGSPFESYTVPAVVLMTAVGGSSFVAMLAWFRRHRLAPIASATAGVMIVTFEVVQVMVIGSPAGAPRVLQAFYALLGATIVGLAFGQRIGPPSAWVLKEIP